MTIGGRLKDERARLRMSQTDLASAAGVSKNTQINYEKDERMPDAGYLLAVASVGVDLNFVLFGKARTLNSDDLNELELEVVRNIRKMCEENRASLRRIAYALTLSDSSSR